MSTTPAPKKLDDLSIQTVKDLIDLILRIQNYRI